MVAAALAVAVVSCLLPPPPLPPNPASPASRRTLLLRLALPALAASPLRPSALAAPPAREVLPSERFYQADDKSFDFILPAGWTLDADAARPRRLFPSHLFQLAAGGGEGRRMQLTVDLGYGNALSSLGREEAAAETLLRYLPGEAARVRSVERVRGAVRGAEYLKLTTEDGRAVKAAVVQKKLFAMAAEGPGAEAVLESFQVWPVNIFCQSASNSGGPIPPGTCY
ncbi:hypothetical protein AB1Y20_014335 [Prymnesium parvum]|uniref:PsbP C-terminal domain-containing protein n=1 Tax=Prymnesium parvum TaxID=97485 RepID=A0AB34IGI9_PRYPA